MNQQFEAVQKFVNDRFDTTAEALNIASSRTKAIAAGTAPFAKTSFDPNAAAFEKPARVKVPDQAIQI